MGAPPTPLPTPLAILYCFGPAWHFVQMSLMRLRDFWFCQNSFLDFAPSNQSSAAHVCILRQFRTRSIGPLFWDRQNLSACGQSFPRCWTSDSPLPGARLETLTVLPHSVYQVADCFLCSMTTSLFHSSETQPDCLRCGQKTCENATTPIVFFSLHWLRG